MPVSNPTPYVPVAQPVSSKTLEQNIPAEYRDSKGNWFGLTRRARVVYASRDRVKQESISYQELADPKWKGKICIRSGQHVYNVAMIAAMIAHKGEKKTEDWLAGWLGLENATDLDQLDPALASDPRLQRGLELWRLGHFGEAKWEMEALRRGTAEGALAQYQLALLFRDIGLFRSSILCARQIIALSPADNALDAPVFIAQLAYPTYY